MPTRYLQYILVCSFRDPIGQPGLPALPHLFYFNLGALASVSA